MSAIFILRKEPKKPPTFLISLKGRYFVMDGSIDVNTGIFRNTSIGFLKSVVLQLFRKYSQIYANLNVKSRPKFYSS